jgi:hypothetical protein
MVKRNVPAEIKVRHTMADGEVLDSIKGFVVPYTPETRLYYELIAKYS